MGNLASWIKKNVITRYVMKKNCPDKQKCFEILETYLDGEATPEETEHFQMQIDSCWCCYKEYELDKVLKKMVKDKGYADQKVPDGLASSILSKIDSSK